MKYKSCIMYVILLNSSREEFRLVVLIVVPQLIKLLSQREEHQDLSLMSTSQDVRE